MGWFNEQIRARKESDQAVFEESFEKMANVVMGRHMSAALNNDREITDNAISDILKFYHVKAQEVPDNIKDMNEVLEYLLRPSGFMRRNVDLESGWYHDAVGAMLASGVSSVLVCRRPVVGVVEPAGAGRPAGCLPVILSCGFEWMLQPAMQAPSSSS